MSKYLTLAAPVFLFLQGCGPAQNDPGPGGVTVGEAKALDDAAKMLDERNQPAQTTTEAGEQPASEAATPAQ